MKKRLRTALLAFGALLLLGGVLWNDKDVARWRASLQNPSAVGTVAQSGGAPADVARYVKAFCEGDVAYLAPHTSPEIANADLLANYFAQDPVTCADSRFLGSVVDNGAMRYVFVLDYGERQDWLVLTFDSGYVVSMRRG